MAARSSTRPGAGSATISPRRSPTDPWIPPSIPTTREPIPRDAQNFKDLVHGIHSAGFRDRAFQHVRGGRQGYYDWSHVAFPRGAGTNDCMLCHMSGTFELPLSDGLLATTVRTTAQSDGMDPDLATAEGAFAAVPNATDWINSPTASACFDCHTSMDAWAHMTQNGALLSLPPFGGVAARSNRSLLGGTFEACSICHGPGRTADVAEVHRR